MSWSPDFPKEAFFAGREFVKEDVGEIFDIRSALESYGGVFL
jgi:hypothetical protein